MEQLSQDVRTFIIDNFLFGDASGSSFDDDDSFIECGVIDSTGIVQLICFLEERYAIRIADDELVPDNLDSVARVARFVTGKLRSSLR